MNSEEGQVYSVCILQISCFTKYNRMQYGTPCLSQFLNFNRKCMLTGRNWGESLAGINQIYTKYNFQISVSLFSFLLRINI